MTMYRKRPVEVEARQFDGENAAALIRWINESGYEHGAYVDSTGAFIIATLEGLHEATRGDFIIQGVAGEFYPCKPDIFEATYEEIV